MQEYDFENDDELEEDFENDDEQKKPEQVERKSALSSQSDILDINKFKTTIEEAHIVLSMLDGSIKKLDSINKSSKSIQDTVLKAGESIEKAGKSVESIEQKLSEKLNVNELGKQIQKEFESLDLRMSDEIEDLMKQFKKPQKLTSKIAWVAGILLFIAGSAASHFGQKYYYDTQVASIQNANNSCNAIVQNRIPLYFEQDQQNFYIAVKGNPYMRTSGEYSVLDIPKTQKKEK